MVGLEPTTYWLQVNCTANCATLALIIKIWFFKSTEVIGLEPMWSLDTWRGQNPLPYHLGDTPIINDYIVLAMCVGFEPTNHVPTISNFQDWRHKPNSANTPYSKNKANGGTWTHDLLITSQSHFQLCYIGKSKINEESGIWTHEPISRFSAFETDPFNHALASLQIYLI